ncbi:MAG: methyltransferase domain-containing protein [Alphaproteobacteria bacterium]
MATEDVSKTEDGANEPKLYRLRIDVEPVASGGLTPALFALLRLNALHCGCGPILHQGWLNTDICVFRGRNGVETKPGDLVRMTGRYYYRHDLEAPLPLPDASMRQILSEHLLEHLSRPMAVAWLADMRRILAPGGVLRLSTPDLEIYVRGYLDPEQAFFRRHVTLLREMNYSSAKDSRAWVMNQLFRMWGHEWIYDMDEIVALAVAAGFPRSAVRRVAYREGTDMKMAALDHPGRHDESIYVEMVKG